MAFEIRVIIDGQEFEVDDQTTVEATYQRDNLLDFASEQLSYTNEVSLPLSLRNQAYIGYANLDTGSSDYIQQTHKVSIIVNSDFIFTREETKVEVGTRIKFRMIDERKAFTERFAGYFLHELILENTSEFTNFRWEVGDTDLTTRMVDQYPYSQYMYLPILDVGEGILPQGSAFLADTRALLPFWHVGNVMKQVMSRFGFSFSSAILNSNLFQRGVISCASGYKDKYTEEDILGRTEVNSILKDFQFLLGGRFELNPTNLREIILVPYDAILSSTPMDWSEYVVGSEPITVDHSFGKWAQDNIFGYEHEPITSPDDTFSITSSNIARPEKNEAFKTRIGRVFEATDDWVNSDTFDISLLQLTNRIVNTPGDNEFEKADTNDGLPCLGFLYNIPSRYRIEVSQPEAGRVYARTSPTNIVAVKWDDDYNASALKSKYELLTKTLNQHQVTCYMRLPTGVVSSRDYFDRIVYINALHKQGEMSGYYMLNKISAYRPDRDVSVTLTKIDY